MINLLKSALFVLFLSTQLYSQQAKEIEKNELNEIKKLPILKRANVEILKAFDIGNLFILDTLIEGQSQELFLTKDKKNLIEGNVMDVNTGEAIYLPLDVSITKNKEAFTFGSGKDEYILFTDLECPYCKNFEAFFPQLEKHVKIKVFFYPLSFHENADDLSIYVMSQKTKQKMIQEYLSVDANSPSFINREISKKEEAKLQIKLQDQIQIAQKFNVSGRPTIFDKNGKKVLWTKLLEKYNLQAK